MSNDIFDGQIFTEKLTKLNNSQQSIESLSRWCISQRKKAKQIVETWDKVFNSSEREQCVSFLYLANDILQNSRRKGSEFVNEFWKVLPSTLNRVYKDGNDQGKKAVTRLVDIWEDRKVFGSRGQSLKDAMFGKDPPLSVSNGKASNPIKVMKRDAHSIRIKLAVGGFPEKIVTAFQSVHEEHFDEETFLNKCETAVLCMGKLEKDAENSFNHGNELSSSLVDELINQENALQQCVEQLKIVEATRAALVSQLREALQDQEHKLDLMQNQMQVAQHHIEQANSLRQKLLSCSVLPLTTTNNNPLPDVSMLIEPDLPSGQPSNTPCQLPLTQPVVSFATTQTSEEKKATAAAVAAKLAASTSSAQMLTSVLSSLVAEEVASKNVGGIKSRGFTSTLPLFSQEKRSKLEKPMLDATSNSDAGNTAYISPLHQPSMSSIPFASSTSMQPLSQSSQMQAPFHLAPPPPPPLPSNQPTSQFAQSAGPMAGVIPYGFTSSSLPPPPPLPSHISMGLARSGPLPPQQSPPQQTQQHQQANAGFYRPPGIGFYGQPHQPSTPPMPRQ